MGFSDKPLENMGLRKVTFEAFLISEDEESFEGVRVSVDPSFITNLEPIKVFDDDYTFMEIDDRKFYIPIPYKHVAWLVENAKKENNKKILMN